MTCRELAAFLVDYLDDQLPPETRQAFEVHLSVCPNCVRYLEQYRASIDLGRAAVAETEDGAAGDFPDDLRRAILAARLPARRG